MSHRRRQSLTAGSRCLVTIDVCCQRAQESLWEIHTSSHWVGQSSCVSCYLLNDPIGLRLPYALRILSAWMLPNTLFLRPWCALRICTILKRVHLLRNFFTYVKSLSVLRLPKPPKTVVKSLRLMRLRKLKFFIIRYCHRYGIVFFITNTKHDLIVF